MATSDFSITLLSDKTPEEVFKAVNDVCKWWSCYYSEEIEGRTEKLNDEFIFRAGGDAHYSKQKLVDVTPNKKEFGWLQTVNSVFLKTPMNGQAQASFLKFLKREKKPNSYLLTKA
jgi:hypothetical protein